MDTKAGRIRALNDALRSTGQGGDVVITRTLAGLPSEQLTEILGAVQTFSEFNTDNDPYGEHDCAVLEAAGERVLFKIDYYDRQLSGHSPDAADPAVTRRVLTIMLASKY